MSENLDTIAAGGGTLERGTLRVLPGDAPGTAPPLLLTPAGGHPPRRLRVGADPGAHRGSFWAVVEQLGEGAVPGRGETLAEGGYLIRRERGATRLVYTLDGPAAALPAGLPAHGDLLVLVKNPDRPGPAGTSPPHGPAADYPRGLRERFGGLRFADWDPDLLDYPGAELLLVAGCGAGHGRGPRPGPAVLAREALGGRLPVSAPWSRRGPGGG